MATGNDEETRRQQLNRELLELLNELRVALAGVTVLFAFLLTLPFTSRFEQLDSLQENTLIFAFFAAASAIVTLVMPTAFHRIRWRHGDKEALLRTSNRLAVVGLVCLSVALTSVVLLFTELFFSDAVAIGVTVAFGAVLAGLWFVFPLVRWARDGSPSSRDR
jgi:predicted membrane channel-forming protein YqfA (hemolysin III family)